MPAKLTARQARGYGIAGKSKYRNRKTVVDGITFDSKKEAARWMVLKYMQENLEIRGLVRQPVFHLVVNDKVICKYIGDFAYFVGTTNNYVVEDCKGFKTAVYRLKAKLFAAIKGFEITEV